MFKSFVNQISQFICYQEWTSLMIAAVYGFYNITKKCIESGVNLDEIDSEGKVITTIDSIMTLKGNI